MKVTNILLLLEHWPMIILFCILVKSFERIPINFSVPSFPKQAHLW